MHCSSPVSFKVRSNLDFLIFIQKKASVNRTFEIDIFFSCCQINLIQRENCSRVIEIEVWFTHCAKI